MPARTYPVRRVLDLSRGLTRVATLGFLGLLAFGLGSALSYKRVIIPLFASVNEFASMALRAIVPPAQVEMTVHVLGLLTMLLGAFSVFAAVRAGINHVVETFMPSLKDGKVDMYRRRVQLAAGPKIVAIGGGTGLSTLLRGLKQHSANITAIVTVTDDGGSSGRLATDKNIIPPGDVRNCLVALADADQALGDLFQFRFGSDSGTLAGHAMGNILITALSDQAKGNFERAVEIASQVLAIRGRVMPSTYDKVKLVATFEDGSTLKGETRIVSARRPIREVALDPPNPKPNPQAVAAILDADVVVLGPGSVYTSILPNLLIPELRDALETTKARRVYVCNVMTQPGETDGKSASGHALAIINALKGRLFDDIIVNTGVPAQSVLENYAAKGQELVDADLDVIKRLGIRALAGDTMSASDLARHDPTKVAWRILGILRR